MGFEPTTFGLGSRHSTAELHPRMGLDYDCGHEAATSDSIHVCRFADQTATAASVFFGIGGRPLRPEGEVGVPSKSIQQWVL
jgi:hypothetical protein